MARARRDEALDFRHRRDVAAGADGRAIEGGGRACKFQTALCGPLPEESVKKAGVKNITRAGRVRHVDVKRRAIEKSAAVKRENAVVAERGRSEFIRKSFVDDLDSPGEMGFSADQAGDIVAGDEVVDFGKERIDAGIKLVEVRNDGNLCGPRPLGGFQCSSGVVAIDEERARGSDPFALNFGWPEREAIVMPTQNGAFACGVNQDEGLIARTAGRGKEMSFDAGAFKCSAMNISGVVVAEFAHVACAQAPRLTRDHSARNFSTRQNGGRLEFDFRAACGKFGERDKSVCGVQADADDIDLCGSTH